jgi:hypothetical protein
MRVQLQHAADASRHEKAPFPGLQRERMMGLEPTDLLHGKRVAGNAIS